MESPYKGKTGFRRIWNAMLYSFDGFAAAFRHEDAFRQEVFLALILIPLALYLPLGGGAKGQLIASVLLVMIVELLNTDLDTDLDKE